MSLQRIQQKIKTSQSTVKITKVMQMVATAKLQKMRPVIKSSVVHKNLVLNIFSEILLQSNKDTFFRNNDSKHKKAMIVTFSSDKGLCGSLNIGLCKETINKAKELQKQGFSVSMKHIGTKANSTFKYKLQDQKISQEYFSDFYIQGKVNNLKIKDLAYNLIDEYTKEKFTNLFIVFNNFKNTISSNIEFNSIASFLPIQNLQNPEAKIDCNIDEIFDYAQFQALFAILMFAINNNILCEHSFRMQAMESATRNTNEIIKDLTKFFNKTRQAYITKSLIDIVSGAESIQAG